MRRAISSLVFAVALLGASFTFASSPVNAPDWVRASAAQTLPTYPEETNAVVLLEDLTVTVTGPGEYVESRRRVVRILRPEGRSEGNLHVHLERDDKVLDIHAFTIDKTGRQYEVKPKEFIEYSPFHEEVYTDIRYSHAEAPAADPGSTIAFESTVRRHPWKNHLSLFAQEDIPVKESRFTLELPPGWEYSAKWSTQAHVEPQQLGPNKWTWNQRDLPGIIDEPMRLHLVALSARVEISYFAPGAGGDNFATWDGVAKWIVRLNEGRRTASPAITDEVRQLVANKSDFDSRVRAITNFMQAEVRYVAIEIGIGGYQPHPAADVFRHRYGDCKDKATLLASMLNEAGIRSRYLLVHTGSGVVKSELPSTFFNHAIVAIELPSDVPEGAYPSAVKTSDGKRFVIFDPTARFVPLGMLHASLQGSYGLLVSDTGGELIRLPLLDPANNTILRIGKFALAADGTLSGEITESRTGDHASSSRYRLADLDTSARTNYIERFASHSLKHASIQNPKIENLDSIDKALVIKYGLQMQSYSQVAGPLLLVRPRVLGQKAFEIKRNKPRNYAFDLSGTSDEKDTFDIELPAGYTVDDLPRPVQIDFGFGAYKSRVEFKGSTLRYEREYIIRDPVIAASKADELRKFEDTIGRDEFASAVLKKQ